MASNELGSSSSFLKGSGSISNLSKKSTMSNNELDKFGLSRGSMHSLADSSGKFGSSFALDVLTKNKNGLRSSGSSTNLSGKIDPLITGMLKQKFIKRCDSEIYCVNFSDDDNYLAVGLGDSTILIMSTKTNEVTRTLVIPNITLKTPCTTIYFRPESSKYKNKNVLVAGYADGKVIHWHFTTGQIIKLIDHGDDQMNSVQYCKDGSHFVTAGSEGTLKIYDGVTFQQVNKMIYGTDSISAGHSNKIFSAKFHPVDKNLLISGGWDNTIQYWDQRIGVSFKSIYGPHICGDSIDFEDSGEKFLTGSYSKETPLQLWSWKEAQMIETVPWTIIDDLKKTCQLYSAGFSHNTNSGSIQNRFVIAAGGGTKNEFRMYETSSKKACAVIQNISHAVYSSAISPSERYVAIGGGGKTVYIYDVDSNIPQDFLY